MAGSKTMIVEEELIIPRLSVQFESLYVLFVILWFMVVRYPKM